MARHDPESVNHPAPQRGRPYPGAPLDEDPRTRLHRDAERCHIFPPKKGTRVMTQGVFDILHLGHLHYFQAARALGDELVVVIARDETVAKNKHAPIFNEEARREMVQGLVPVDAAVLGHKGDFYRIVEEAQPDIICIGYDQPYQEDAIEAECRRRGLEVKVVRLEHMDYDLDSTRKVVEAIAARLANKELYHSDRAARDADTRQTPTTSRTTGAAAEKVNNPQAASPDVKEEAQ